MNKADMRETVDALKAIAAELHGARYEMSSLRRDVQHISTSLRRLAHFGELALIEQVRARDAANANANANANAAAAPVSNSSANDADGEVPDAEDCANCDEQEMEIQLEEDPRENTATPPYAEYRHGIAGHPVKIPTGVPVREFTP